MMIFASFLIGFVTAIVSAVFVAKKVVQYAIEKGWYASAIYNKKENTWKVSGNYLRIGNRILRGIRQESNEKVKYVA